MSATQITFGKRHWSFLLGMVGYAGLAIAFARGLFDPQMADWIRETGPFLIWTTLLAFVFDDLHYRTKMRRMGKSYPEAFLIEVGFFVFFGWWIGGLSLAAVGAVTAASTFLAKYGGAGEQDPDNRFGRMIRDGLEILLFFFVFVAVGVHRMQYMTADTPFWDLYRDDVTAYSLWGATLFGLLVLVDLYLHFFPPKRPILPRARLRGPRL